MSSKGYRPGVPFVTGDPSAERRLKARQAFALMRSLKEDAEEAERKKASKRPQRKGTR